MIPQADQQSADLSPLVNGNFSFVVNLKVCFLLVTVYCFSLYPYILCTSGIIQPLSVSL